MAAEPIPVPQTPVDGIADQVAHLRAAFDRGLTRPAAWRIQQIERVRDMMSENADASAEALRLDVGKPELEAYAADIMTLTEEAKAVATVTETATSTAPLDRAQLSARLKDLAASTPARSRSDWVRTRPRRN